MHTAYLQWTDNGKQTFEGKAEYEQRFKDASGFSEAAPQPTNLVASQRNPTVNDEPEKVQEVVDG